MLNCFSITLDPPWYWVMSTWFNITFFIFFIHIPFVHENCRPCKFLRCKLGNTDTASHIIYTAKCRLLFEQNYFLFPFIQRYFYSCCALNVIFLNLNETNLYQTMYSWRRYHNSNLVSIVNCSACVHCSCVITEEYKFIIFYTRWQVIDRNDKEQISRNTVIRKP